MKYFLPISLVCLFIVFQFAVWIKDKRDFVETEKEIALTFNKLLTYKDDVYLSNVSVISPSGKMVRIDNKDKQYTVLNIWATWCAPCVKELPSLKRLDQILPNQKGWRVMAVSIDANKDIEKISAFTKKLNVTNIASYYDINGDLQKSLNIKGLPTTLILNNHGMILYEIRGDAFWHEEKVVDFLNKVRKFK